MIAGIRILMTLVVAPPIHVLSSIKAFAVRRLTAMTEEHRVCRRGFE
jgi:hypothetical protein